MSQNGNGHSGIPRHLLRLTHAFHPSGGKVGDCGSANSSDINRDTLSQATGCLQQLCSSVPLSRPPGTVLCKSYADVAAGSPPASQSVLALDLQAPGGIGDCRWDSAGRVPTQNGALHSVGLRQRRVERPAAARARLDSATATAKQEKAALKQAQKALEQARL